MNNQNNNPNNQNNMDVNYNMGIEHKFKCFRLRTKQPYKQPNAKPEYYMKLPTYEWSKYIFVNEDGQEVPYNFKAIEEKKIFKKAVDYHPHQKQWLKYKNHYKEQHNMGVPTGKINNITVVDLDFYKDGEEDGNINLFNQEFGSDYNVFNTYTVRTGSGGWHLYFKFNSAVKQTADGNTNVDIRSTGGYVVSAGTSFTTSTGEFRAYTVQNDVPVAEMPENLEKWLLDNIYKGDGLEKKKKQKRNPIIKVINPITKVEEEIEYDKVNLGVYKFNLSDTEIEKYFCEGLPDYFFHDREHHIKFATAMKTLDRYDLFKKWSFKRCIQNEEYELYEDSEEFLKNVWCYIEKHNQLFMLEHLGKKSDEEGAENILGYTKFKPTECHNEQPSVTINRNKLGYGFIEEFIGDNKCIVARSDTGTGKTTSMKHYFKDNSDKMFLSIVSRISLGKEQNKVFQQSNIECKYWEEAKEELDEINQHRHFSNHRKWDRFEGKNMVITIDSLCKLNAFENFEGYTVYLDEFNSLIEYLVTCGNMGNKRVLIYKLFRKILKECELIVCSDADISDNSLLLLKNWDIDYLYINNEYKHNNGIKATEIPNFNNFMDKLNSEPKWMCCADSKTMVDIMARLNKQCKVYTSDYSGDIDLDEDDCVIFSPKIVYGLDSVMKRPVFCYYKCQTITPAAMVQQICRNRNITELFFHFEHLGKMVQPYNYETVEDCKEDIIARDKYGNDMFSIVDKTMAEEYVNLLAGFEYNYDCYDTNKFGHFMNIISSRGFICDMVPQKTEFCDKLKQLEAEMKCAKAKDIKKLCKGFEQYHLENNKGYIEELTNQLKNAEFYTALPFGNEDDIGDVEYYEDKLEKIKSDDYDEECIPTEQFPEWIIRKNEILKIPFSKIGSRSSYFSDPAQLPKHMAVSDMFFRDDEDNKHDLSDKDDFNAQKVTTDKSKVILCNKFKRMIGFNDNFMETPLDDDGYFNEEIVKPLDEKTLKSFIKEYKTVFRYRGKNFTDLTDKHECVVFYAKMVNSICGGVLEKKKIPEDKKNNKPASCKYKYDIKILKDHLDLLSLRSCRVPICLFNKYFDDNTKKQNQYLVAYKKPDRYLWLKQWMKSFGPAHFII